MTYGNNLGYFGQQYNRGNEVKVKLKIFSCHYTLHCWIVAVQYSLVFDAIKIQHLICMKRCCCRVCKTIYKGKQIIYIYKMTKNLKCFLFVYFYLSSVATSCFYLHILHTRICLVFLAINKGKASVSIGRWLLY
jgi:hypothetical protein